MRGRAASASTDFVSLDWACEHFSEYDGSYDTIPDQGNTWRTVPDLHLNLQTERQTSWVKDEGNIQVKSNFMCGQVIICVQIVLRFYKMMLKNERNDANFGDKISFTLRKK